MSGETPISPHLPVRFWRVAAHTAPAAPRRVHEEFSELDFSPNAAKVPLFF